jgi:small-conductance mechanosensitive channel
MHTETMQGIGPLQVLAILFHLGILIIIQQIWNRLAKQLRVDRLSLVNDRSTRTAVVRALMTRTAFWIWACGLYTLFAWHLNGFLSPLLGPDWATHSRQVAMIKVLSLLVLCSLVGRLIYVTNIRLRTLAAGDSSHWESVIAVLCADALQVGIPLVAGIFLLSRLSLPKVIFDNSREIVNAIVILATGYIACRQVNLAAEKIIQVHKVKGGVDLRSRALYTEVSALRKAILFAVIFLTLATTMIFCAPLRHIGTSLLASAGIFTVVAGVAVQRSFGHLFAGFQLALTQPFLLDDIVVVEGETGKVEEITLAYVVVQLWDQRRLVVPISHFLEKPFENWTRRSPELLGTVFLYFDYHLSINELREYFCQYLETHPAWDKRTRSLVVTDAKETAMQVRVLISAANPDQLWTLRCDVREALICFVQDKHPQNLPMTRVLVQSGTGSPPAIQPPARLLNSAGGTPFENNMKSSASTDSALGR